MQVGDLISPEVAQRKYIRDLRRSHLGSFSEPSDCLAKSQTQKPPSPVCQSGEKERCDRGGLANTALHHSLEYGQPSGARCVHFSIARIRACGISLPIQTPRPPDCQTWSSPAWELFSRGGWPQGECSHVAVRDRSQPRTAECGRATECGRGRRRAGLALLQASMKTMSLAL